MASPASGLRCASRLENILSVPTSATSYRPPKRLSRSPRLATVWHLHLRPLCLLPADSSSLAPREPCPFFAKTFGYISMTAVRHPARLPCSPPGMRTGLVWPAPTIRAGATRRLAAHRQTLRRRPVYSGFHARPSFSVLPVVARGGLHLGRLFMQSRLPEAEALFVTYTLWMWWATMYLSHHYAVDLVGVAFWPPWPSTSPRLDSCRVSSVEDFAGLDMSRSGIARRVGLRAPQLRRANDHRQ